VLDSVYRALIFILPAYVANGSPVVISRLIPLLHPIDGGKKFLDNRRILGNGKTIEGFLGGVILGTATSLVLEFMGLHSVGEGFVLSVGALVGDIAGSFIKRRLGLERGDPAPLLDQLDFLFGALLLYSIFYGSIDLEETLILIVITPVIHLATNMAAYALKLKDRPW